MGKGNNREIWYDDEASMEGVFNVALNTSRIKMSHVVLNQHWDILKLEFEKIAYNFHQQKYADGESLSNSFYTR